MKSVFRVLAVAAIFGCSHALGERGIRLRKTKSDSEDKDDEDTPTTTPFVSAATASILSTTPVTSVKTQSTSGSESRFTLVPTGAPVPSVTLPSTACVAALAGVPFVTNTSVDLIHSFESTLSNMEYSLQDLNKDIEKGLIQEIVGSKCGQRRMLLEEDDIQGMAVVEVKDLGECQELQTTDSYPKCYRFRVTSRAYLSGASSVTSGDMFTDVEQGIIMSLNEIDGVGTFEAFEDSPSSSSERNNGTSRGSESLAVPVLVTFVVVAFFSLTCLLIRSLSRRGSGAGIPVKLSNILGFRGVDRHGSLWKRKDLVSPSGTVSTSGDRTLLRSDTEDSGSYDTRPLSTRMKGSKNLSFDSSPEFDVNSTKRSDVGKRSGGGVAKDTVNL